MATLSLHPPKHHSSAELLTLLSPLVSHNCHLHLVCVLFLCPRELWRCSRSALIAFLSNKFITIVVLRSKVSQMNMNANLSTTASSPLVVKRGPASAEVEVNQWPDCDRIKRDLIGGYSHGMCCCRSARPTSTEEFMPCPCQTISYRGRPEHLAFLSLVLAHTPGSVFNEIN